MLCRLRSTPNTVIEPTRQGKFLEANSRAYDLLDEGFEIYRLFPAAAANDLGATQHSLNPHAKSLTPYAPSLIKAAYLPAAFVRGRLAHVLAVD